MSGNWLLSGLLAVSLFYGIRLIDSGHWFEGALLIVFGAVLGTLLEAFLLIRRCEHCGKRLKKAAAGLYYCEECRSFFEKPRRVKWGLRRDDG